MLYLIQITSVGKPIVGHGKRRKRNMWKYEKRLQYPVSIKRKDLRVAKYLVTQYGGSNGEMAAALRYLNQRYTMPDDKGKALLTDIATEEFGHVEMICAMVYQLTKGASLKELKDPFEPKQFILLEMFIIGFASVLLALEPNNKRIEGSYLETVIIRSFPNALAMLVPVIALMIVEKFITMSLESRNSIAMSVILAVSFINLFALCKPFTKWRAFVVSLIGGLIAIAIPVSIFALGDMLRFKPVMHNLLIFAIMLFVGIAFTVLMQIFRGKIEKIIEKNIERNKERDANRKNTKKKKSV